MADAIVFVTDILQFLWGLHFIEAPPRKTW